MNSRRRRVADPNNAEPMQQPTSPSPSLRTPPISLSSIHSSDHPQFTTTQRHNRYHWSFCILYLKLPKLPQPRACPEGTLQHSPRGAAERGRRGDDRIHEVWGIHDFSRKTGESNAIRWSGGCASTDAGAGSMLYIYSMTAGVTSRGRDRGGGVGGIVGSVCRDGFKAHAGVVGAWGGVCGGGGGGRRASAGGGAGGSRRPLFDLSSWEWYRVLYTL